MRGQVQELRLDSYNPNGKREAHFRVGEFSDDPFVVGDVFIDCVRECLHRGDEDADIDEAEGVGHLEFENIGVPASHVPELNLYLYAALLEVRTDIRDSVIRDQGLGLPPPILKECVNESIERELIGSENHASTPALPGLRWIELWNIMDRSENVEDILFQTVKRLTVEHF